MIKQKIAILVFILSLFLPLSYVSAGTVLSLYKYAWSNNAGYINFENVNVNNGALSGYAWSSNSGWIKFNPVQGGVLNDGTGNLSGSAWGESLGWIDFDGVSINGSTGKFSGTATGSLVGTITFDCPNYCDVRTDWRRAITPPVVSSSGSSGGGYVPIGSTLPKINSQNVPLIILPEQSGTLTQDTPAGQIIVEVPTKAVTNRTTFTITDEVPSQTNDYLIVSDTKIVGGLFYNVSVKDDNGNEIHYFSNPITITLPIPMDFIGVKNLAVYWLNEINQQWVLVPDAVFVNNKVTFKVDHLTKFAILKLMGSSLHATKQPAQSLLLSSKKHVTKQTEKINQQTPVNDEVGTSSKKVQSESLRNVNWNLITPLIILILIVFIFFLRKGKKGNNY